MTKKIKITEHQLSLIVNIYFIMIDITKSFPSDAWIKVMILSLISTIFNLFPFRFHFYCGDSLSAS